MIDKLGPYRIEKVVGRGGMGTVYAAVHQRSGERAAIKALSLALADDTNFRERFMAEIETLKVLDHPNIVRLYGEGQQDGYLFYVMEYVEGRSLQQELQSGHRFDWREVTRIAIEVCSALKHAHDRGVIHRDLKPANLLRSRDGRIKLTDFGIAKLFGGTNLTAHGSVVGTADYMSPEQAEGGQITHRSDLYSLGSVMFTLLARRPAFSGPSLPQVLHKLRYDDVPSVRRFAPSVPAELDLIIGQLLQKEPQDRIATALALANRLKAMLHALGAEPEVDPAEQDTSEQPLVAAGDEQATKASGPRRASATEVAPTAVDGDLEGRERYPWNSSTVVTSDERSEIAPSDNEQNTIAEVPADAENRFLAADEALRRAERSLREEEGSGSDHLKTIALAVTLLVLVLVAVWGMWPASADTLYARIISITADSGAEGAKKHIDEFVARFPHDPRFEEVDGLRKDVETEWLQSRLALKELMSGGAALEPYEQEYLQAMRIKTDDPETARSTFHSLLEEHQDRESPSPELEQCLDAARHQLARLEQR